MTDRRDPIEPRGLRRAVRDACLEVAQAAYEDAAIRGLCGEGAFEVACDALRSLDVETLALEPPAEGPEPFPDLSARTAALSRRFADEGPPAAGSAAAVTAALAAGLLEWTARRSAQRGTEAFRERALAIAGRAASLRERLSSDVAADAVAAGGLMAGASGERAAARQSAATSLLEIATRASSVMTLAAEVAGRGHRASRSDVEAALRLAGAATEGLLELAEETLGRPPSAPWLLDARRRAWRIRLVQRRAARSLAKD